LYETVKEQPIETFEVPREMHYGDHLRAAEREFFDKQTRRDISFSGDHSHHTASREINTTHAHTHTHTLARSASPLPSHELKGHHHSSHHGEHLTGSDWVHKHADKFPDPHHDSKELGVSKLLKKAKSKKNKEKHKHDKPEHQHLPSHQVGQVAHMHTHDPMPGTCPHTHTHVVPGTMAATEPIVGHHQNIGAHHLPSTAIAGGHNRAYDAAICKDCAGNHSAQDIALMQKRNEMKQQQDIKLSKKQRQQGTLTSSTQLNLSGKVHVLSFRMTPCLLKQPLEEASRKRQGSHKSHCSRNLSLGESLSRDSILLKHMREVLIRRKPGPFPLINVPQNRGYSSKAGKIRVGGVAGGMQRRDPP